MKNLKNKVQDAYQKTKAYFKRKVGQFAKFCIKIKTKITHSDTLEYLLTVELTPIFIFALSFILTVDYALWERLLFSIGLYHVTEYIVEKITQVKVVS